MNPYPSEKNTMTKFKPTRPTDLGQPTTCPSCKTAIWILTVNGIRTILDTTPITPVEEIHIRTTQNRYTYTIHQTQPHSTHWYANIRFQQEILKHPTGIILPAHQHTTTPTKTHPQYFPPKHNYQFTDTPAF